MNCSWADGPAVVVVAVARKEIAIAVKAHLPGVRRVRIAEYSGWSISKLGSAVRL